ncbi:hypothetical protein [Streptomyces sp. NPDC057253]|uniref:hypothetical protein n=1 Tax=Streptomyces sp. NPDC057253 TaxID=3346069 RepID=UPI00363F7994
MVQEFGDGRYAAAAGELLAQVFKRVRAACGIDASHPVDGIVCGGHGGVDVAETEVGFGEPG